MSLLLKVAIGMLIAFVVIASAGLLFSARPTPLLGVDGDSLAHSVDDSIGTCLQGDGKEWICLGRSGNVTLYVVEVGWDGCWDAARPKGRRGPPRPENKSGCIDIWDHLRLEKAPIFD